MGDSEAKKVPLEMHAVKLTALETAVALFKQLLKSTPSKPVALKSGDEHGMLAMVG